MTRRPPATRRAFSWSFPDRRRPAICDWVVPEPHPLGCVGKFYSLRPAVPQRRQFGVGMAGELGGEFQRHARPPQPGHVAVPQGVEVETKGPLGESTEYGIFAAARAARSMSAERSAHVLVRFPKVRGHEVNGADSDLGVHRCLASARRTRPSSSSRP